MASPALAVLLATPSPSAIKDKLLAGLNVDGFPITDFESGGAFRTLVEATGQAINDYSAQLVPEIAAGGFLDEAEGDWLTLLAAQLFQLERVLATYTVQLLKLTAAPGSGPYTVNPGDLVAQADSGNRYTLAAAGTIPLSGTVTLAFKAESPGAAYNDPAGQISRLLTALPGVSVLNEAPTFSDVALAGTGTGTVTPSAPGGPPTQRTVSIAITLTGQAGAAEWSYSLDGGVYVAAGTVPAGFFDIAGGIRVTFANGAANPSFIAGDRYTFTTPGSPIDEQGRDDETDEALRARCRSRWSALSAVPSEEKYELWAGLASSQVTKVIAQPSETVPGQIDVVIAGAVNPLGGGVVTAVQDYIDLRAGNVEDPVVVAATAVVIDVAGTVFFRGNADRLAEIQAAAQLAWNAYLAELPIGAVVYASELAQALMDAGALDVDLFTLEVMGAASFALASTEVAAGSATALSAALTWTPA